MEISNEIYELNTYTMEWSIVGKMEIPKNYHSVSVIKLEDYWPYCVNDSFNEKKYEELENHAKRELPFVMLLLLCCINIYL